jgi:hypothetical protein
MAQYLILHGHFYQPPRENPWTGVIPKQKSAAPFSNWNKKITRECYGANSASRILNRDGKIVEIMNNYEHISFNFGPTLLGWLKEEAPNVYRRILEADKKSIKRNQGHGNAIAQSYNHSILPLDSEEYAETQIIWGLEDFRSHFGRDSEGLWLPECAINQKTAELLVRNGVKYTILNPRQAASYGAPEDRNFTQLHHRPIPSHEPYFLETRAGNLTVFFYNPELSSGISFDHFLRDADQLLERVRQLQKRHINNSVLTAATDGEIYGHHEPFGDMCLAAFIQKIRSGREFQMTNFGRYLELYPPTKLVTLEQSEENNGSSWSCSHGIERWRSNCGCVTGSRDGWRQDWRAPLRKAITECSQEINLIYSTEMHRLTKKSPQKVRNSYIKLLSGTETAEQFFDEYDIPADEQSSALSLLESQKYSMFSFTSCGWFFADLAGIEPVQNLAYLIESIYLLPETYQEVLIGHLETELEKAQSNLGISGREVLRSQVLDEITRVEAVAAVGIFRRLLGIENTKYGIFDFVHCSIRPGSKGMSCKGMISIKNRSIEKTYQLNYRILYMDSTLHLQIGSSQIGDRVLPLDRLPEEAKKLAGRILTLNLEEDLLKPVLEFYEKAKEHFQTSKSIGIEPSAVLYKTVELGTTRYLEQLIPRHNTMMSSEALTELTNLLSFSTRNELAIHLPLKRLSRHIAAIMSIESMDNERVNYLKKIMDISDRNNAKLDITVLQTHIYEHLRKKPGDSIALSCAEALGFEPAEIVSGSLKELIYP